MPNWSDLRTEIEETRQRLGVPENQFRPLKVMEWRGIEEKIYHTFCNLNSPVARPIWLWECFKLEKYAVYSHNYPLEIVDRIVESKEKV